MEINIPNAHEERIAARDKISPSPEQRAAHLWAEIQRLNPKPTQWDIVCFCTEALGVIAAHHEFLQAVVKQLNRTVYTAHYYTDTPIDSCLELASKEPQGQTTSELDSSLLTVKKG